MAMKQLSDLVLGMAIMGALSCVWTDADNDAFYGARFKSEKLMWNYMTKFVGAHQHDFNSTKVYCNADGPARGSEEGVAREKAARKVVRVIIESNGGDGQAVVGGRQPGGGGR